MALYLGIDGGGTGCRAVVAGAAGPVLGRGTGGPANITSDPVAARASILAAAMQAVAAAGGADLGGIHAGLGLAGANAAGPDALDLPFARARIVTDAQTAVLGALGAGDGIVAAIGTGSVFASQRAGVFRQIGGKGLVLGDEGSGAWLGRRLLAQVLRAADGFLPPTPLAQAMLAEMGGEAGVISFAARATPADFAALVPRIIDSPDPLAGALLADGAREVAAALELLDHDQTRQAVFLGGLGGVYAGLLAPRWQAVDPQGTALDGALMLARGLG